MHLDLKFDIGIGSAFPNATYQVRKSSVFWFWRRWVFTIYVRGGHLSIVTWTIWTYLFPLA